nr:hypothetical protein Iba_chr03aCG0880 [Ipomoea batatas]GMC71246.1 hypothetical protein Iba_chr03bCG0980 [Ipomoea batatas]
MSRLILSFSVFSSSPFHTISSRHRQIFPYLSKKRRSVGGFPHTSLMPDVMTKIASDTASSSYSSLPTTKMLTSPSTVYTI